MSEKCAWVNEWRGEEVANTNPQNKFRIYFVRKEKEKRMKK